MLEEVEQTRYSIQPLEQKFPKPSKLNYCIIFCTFEKKKKKRQLKYFTFVDTIFHLPTGAFCTCCCWFLGGCHRTTCFARALWRCLVQPHAQSRSSKPRLRGDLSSQVWASPRTEILQPVSIFEYFCFNSVTISIKNTQRKLIHSRQLMNICSSLKHTLLKQKKYCSTDSGQFVHHIAHACNGNKIFLSPGCNYYQFSDC